LPKESAGKFSWYNDRVKFLTPARHPDIVGRAAGAGNARLFWVADRYVLIGYMQEARRIA